MKNRKIVLYAFIDKKAQDLLKDLAASSLQFEEDPDSNLVCVYAENTEETIDQKAVLFHYKVNQYLYEQISSTVPIKFALVEAKATFFDMLWKEKSLKMMKQLEVNKNKAEFTIVIPRIAEKSKLPEKLKGNSQGMNYLRSKYDDLAPEMAMEDLFEEVSKELKEFGQLAKSLNKEKMSCYLKTDKSTQRAEVEEALARIPECVSAKILGPGPLYYFSLAE